MSLSRTALPLAAALMAPPLLAQTARPLTPDDVYALKTVGDPRISPDGALVAYTVTTAVRARDKNDTDVWIAPLDGGPAFRLTSSPKPETRPRFSPDGRFVAFLAARGGKKKQVFLLD